ncbi:MAG: hypothetical protein IPL10_20145 [Bacteroidetes bacterium]|nr:hypothetical protein [Bacteroidota bacterium]
MVFNGEFEPAVKQSIINYSSESQIIDIPTLNSLNKQHILEISNSIKAQNAL